MNLLKNKIRVCIVSGSRADYGLLHPLIKKIKNDKYFKMNFIVTGSHLSKKNDYTIKEIVNDKVKISNKVFLVGQTDSEYQITKSMGKSLIEFGNLLKKDKFDLMILLGDRYEILPPAIAAYMINLRICHISGGEITYGSLDDGIRHTITKLSTFHFVSSNIYKKRVIQLGENPKNIINVGSLSIDKIRETQLLTKKLIEKKLKFNFLKKNILITFHPITNDTKQSKFIFNEILIAINKLDNTRVIFTAPNSDSGGIALRKKILKYIKQKKNVNFIPNLGSLMYFSVLKQCDLVLGNSSSGLTEAPYLKTPTINISNRQEGRIRSVSVIDTIGKSKHIYSSIQKVYSSNFKINNSKFFLGNGKASFKIIKYLKKINFNKSIQKKFFDINFSI